MDRYGASTRDFESDDDYEYTRRGAPLDRDDDYGRGYGRADLMHERETFHGERSGLGHRSEFSDDEDTDHGRHGRPTHRPDASSSDRYRSSADVVRGDGPRRRGYPTGTPDDSDSDYSEVERGDRDIRSRGLGRRGETRRPDPRFRAGSSEDESDLDSRATREGHRGPGIRRAQPLRPDVRFNGGGSAGRGAARASTTDDESDSEQYGSRRGNIGDARGGMHPGCRGHQSDDDDLDDSEDEGMRRGRRGAISFGRPSTREFY